jgi:hypothetical protein
MFDMRLFLFGCDGWNKDNRRFPSAGSGQAFDSAEVRSAQNDRPDGGNPSMLPEPNQRDTLARQRQV